ncbi:hypothetical protein [Streptomyces sp. sk2.1]|uniref:hypothetical protein n=1 Tax=Streptomyces sp. sk2.1 TaxID=2478959 RepID=UPI0011E81088|nr:hypothetical protein [Streptomyces sp. sk2.1]TXS69904.1 hypothetical protein EAO76_24395 [Streptomyces sp. sk2.1]
MTPDHLTAPATTPPALTARPEYHSDWHIYVDDPVDGPLGYCTGTGPDENFDPAAATRALEQGGWRVTRPWTEMPPTAEAPFTATAERTDGAGDRSRIS